MGNTEKMAGKMIVARDEIWLFFFHDGVCVFRWKILFINIFENNSYLRRYHSTRWYSLNHMNLAQPALSLFCPSPKKKEAPFFFSKNETRPFFASRYSKSTTPKKNPTNMHRSDGFFLLNTTNQIFSPGLGLKISNGIDPSAKARWFACVDEKVNIYIHVSFFILLTRQVNRCFKFGFWEHRVFILDLFDGSFGTVKTTVWCSSNTYWPNACWMLHNDWEEVVSFYSLFFWRACSSNVAIDTIAQRIRKYSVSKLTSMFDFTACRLKKLLSALEEKDP